MDPRLKHLELIHNVITRLATDSFQLKRWAVALFSGLLAFLFGTESTRHTTILLFPVVVFWGLDGYFLWRERLFRALYDHVRLAQSSATDFFDGCRRIPDWLAPLVVWCNLVPYSDSVLRSPCRFHSWGLVS